jgi:hypothetical protein
LMSLRVAASSGQRTGRRRSPGTVVGVAPAGAAAEPVSAADVAPATPAIEGFLVVITRLA